MAITELFELYDLKRENIKLREDINRLVDTLMVERREYMDQIDVLESQVNNLKVIIRYLEGDKL
jgi:hypothetical protein